MSPEIAKIVLASLALAPVTTAAYLIGAARRRRIDLARALARLGIRGRVHAIAPLGGGRANALWRVRIGDRSVIVKQALPMGTVLALGARWVGPQPFAADVSASARVTREARALEALASRVRVPRLLAVDHTMLVLEDVAGVPLSQRLSPDRIAAYGRAIADAHAAGVVLTDGHPGNALALADGRIALVDLEFAELARDLGDARFAARRAFDVAYAAAFFAPHERATFLRAAGEPPGVAKAAKDLAPFAPLFARERARQARAAAGAGSPRARSASAFSRGQLPRRREAI